MEEFYTKLYSSKTSGRADYTYARYEDGCISFIEGTDFWGDDDYEDCYGMILDKESSDKLIALIRGENQSVEEAIIERLNGCDILHPVEVFLKENGLKYRWSSDKNELGW